MYICMNQRCLFSLDLQAKSLGAFYLYTVWEMSFHLLQCDFEYAHLPSLTLSAASSHAI